MLLIVVVGARDEKHRGVLVHHDTVGGGLGRAKQLLRLRYGARETWTPPVETFREARRAWRLAKKQRVAR